MTKIKNILGCVATGFLLSVAVSGAHADPILSGSILNNGQVIGPNDSITWTVRIENTGDAAFSSAWQTATGAFATPPGNYSAFDFPTAGYPAFQVTPLAAGSFFDFEFFTLIPDAGGAAVGPYVGNNPFTLLFFDQTLVTFGTANWTVVANGVPEPSSLALLGLALAGLALSRRRKLK